MRWNPIWIKELKIRARVVRIPILLMFYNAVVALIAMFMLIASVDIMGGGYVDYSGMTSLFVGLSVLQFCVGFLVTLVMTSNAISNERERGTLDLMLVTPVSPRTLIGGKMLSAMTTSSLFAVSSFPVLAISSVYGGIGFEDIFYMIMVFLLIILYAGSAGILCSSLMERSSTAIISSLILEIIVYAGPFVVLEIINTFFYSKTQGLSDPSFAVNGWVFILIVSPIILIIDFYDRVMGGNRLMDMFFYTYGIGEETGLSYFLQKHFIQCCIVVQLLLSLIFLLIAMKRLGITKKRTRKRRFLQKADFKKDNDKSN